jgi:protein-tyrosine phosphatase
MIIKTVRNFRDIGGIPVNGNFRIIEGVFYRSATVDHISREDATKLRDLNIRTIIDLRAPKEVKRNRRSIDHSVTLSMPLDFQQTTRDRLRPYLYKKGTEEILADISNQLYLDILDAAAPVFRQLIELLLSGENTPLLIHCQAGKDRTGIMTALLLLALGAEREWIVSDFLKSNDALIPYFKKLLIIRKIITFGFFPSARMLYVVTVKKRNIDSIIDRVENHYGGIEGFLSSAGLNSTDILKLREKYCTV